MPRCRSWASARRARSGPVAGAGNHRQLGAWPSTVVPFGGDDFGQHTSRRALRAPRRSPCRSPARTASRPGPPLSPTALNHVQTVASVTLSPKRRHHDIDRCPPLRHLVWQRTGLTQAGLWRACALSGLGPPWPGAFGNRGQQGIDPHRFPLGGDDVGKGAGHRAWHLDRHLVGFQLAQHLIDGDGLAGLLEPGGNGGFGDAFAQGGYADLRLSWLISL